jgi:hypothetical protein
MTGRNTLRLRVGMTGPGAGEAVGGQADPLSGSVIAR